VNLTYSSSRTHVGNVNLGDNARKRVQIKVERFSFLKKEHSLFWNAFSTVLFDGYFPLGEHIFQCKEALRGRIKKLKLKIIQFDSNIEGD